MSCASIGSKSGVPSSRAKPVALKILRSCENDALDYQAKAGLLAPRDEVRG